MPAGKNLSSTSDVIGGNAILFFSSGYGIISDGRYSTLENLKLSTSAVNTGAAVLFKNSKGSDHHLLTFKNLIIDNFQTGFKTDIGNYLWNVSFKDIRLNVVENALLLGNGNNSTFGLVFERFYANGSKKIMEFTGVRATFDSYNFGINSVDALVFGANTEVIFRSCNFECDSFVEGTGNIFKLSSKSVKFEQCSFPMNTAATVSCIGNMGSMELVSFEECTYVSIGQNAMTNFFSRNNSNTAQLFAIKLLGASNSIPRPDFYSAQQANWVDIGNNILPRYNSFVDAVKLKEGMVLYDPNRKIPVYYDGSKIRSTSGFETRKGTYTGSGTGSTTLNIPHGLESVPIFYHVESTSEAAGNAGIKFVIADATNLIVTFHTAPVVGTNNIKLVWKAET
ncbi:hypothetical protein ACTQ5F_08030 [Jeotgalibaca porci]|uniref:hypothetical protein n=1 Tax=Jeotgalibaca porci TaxID=1868793 RepID=UPI003F8DCC67